MKSAARSFYIALFALWAGRCRGVEESCAISPKAIVSDACASYSTLDRVNANIQPALDLLTGTTDFFSHYRLNLFNKKCPFWEDENGMCGNQACAVLTLDSEDDIPEVWRAGELSKLEGPSAKHPGRQAQRERPRRPLQGELGEDVGESCVVEYDDECDERDYCVPEDESTASRGDYVSLLQNPERFTGYSGAGARQVWDTIYRENCFGPSSFPSSAGLAAPLSPWQGGGGLAAMGPAALDFRQVLEAAGRQELVEQHHRQPDRELERGGSGSSSSSQALLAPFDAQTGLDLEGECLEKRVFYRVISGMHASISTHLCWDFFNQTTGEWHPNLECYRPRLHDHPDRISNVYFNYALVTRAVAKLGPHLADPGRYTFCTGDPGQDRQTRAKVAAVAARAAAAPPLFDESLMFQNGEGPSLKEEFRQRFRNVSRIMDCVGCDKCRLWGKIQTAGYGTALKVLFETDNGPGGGVGGAGGPSREPPLLKRTELVALFNTYARLSNSVSKIGQFKEMMAAAEPGLGSEPGPESEPESELETELEPGSEPETAGNEKKKPQAITKVHVIVIGTVMVQQDSPPDGRPSTSEPEEEEELPLMSEIFWDEFGRVMSAYKVVLRGWIGAPKLMWDIASSEAVRLGQLLIGLPVNPRSWSIERPRLDEL